MKTPQEEGREFGQEWAEELGLEPIPGSGNMWHSKLDVQGFKARWSLKFTRFKSFPLSQDVIDEALQATEGPGGDGSVPLWAVRLGSRDYDLVVMRRSDFVRMASEQLKFARGSKTEAKRRYASTPILLRQFEEDGA